ncbi:unnamed protein product, partial [marine sediment metagenome]
GEDLYSKLPNWVQKLVTKALAGKPIKGVDRQLLDKGVRQRPIILVEPDYERVY